MLKCSTFSFTQRKYSKMFLLLKQRGSYRNLLGEKKEILHVAGTGHRGVHLQVWRLNQTGGEMKGNNLIRTKNA